MHKWFICRALETLGYKILSKEDIVFGTGSPFYGAKIRINLVSTKENGRFLLKESLAVDQSLQQKQTLQNENRLTKSTNASGCINVD